MQDDPVEALAGAVDLEPVRRRDMRHVLDLHGQDQHPLVQHLVVLEIVQQRRRDGVRPRSTGRPRCRAPGAPSGRRLDEDVERKRVLVRAARASARRPVAQVVSTVKITAATTSGNQPPSAILVMFDAKIGAVDDAGTAPIVSAASDAVPLPHLEDQHRRACIVVMIIVPLTAMP